MTVIGTAARVGVDRGMAVRTALVVLAVGQAVASGLVSAFGGAFTSADRAGEPLIVPPGPFFSFWSLVIAFSVGYAVWAWPEGRPSRALRDQLARPLLLVTAGFSLWLVAAELEPVWTTLVVFLGLFGCLVWALRVATRSRAEIAQWSPLGRALLWGAIGLYCGWTSIAIWLNLATAMVGSGAPLHGAAGTLGQLAILVGATAGAAALVRYTHGLVPYVVGAGWALGGAALGALAAGAPLLAGVAAAGLTVVLVGSGVEVARRRRVAGPRG